MFVISVIEFQYFQGTSHERTSGLQISTATKAQKSGQIAQLADIEQPPQQLKAIIRTTTTATTTTAATTSKSQPTTTTTLTPSTATTQH
jgi:hypothetical protein